MLVNVALLYRATASCNAFDWKDDNTEDPFRAGHPPRPVVRTSMPVRQRTGQ